MRHTGKIRNITGVSMAGKTTLLELFTARRHDVHRSISLTTRPQRPAEINGRDYHFCTKEAFEATIKAGRMLEYAVVWGGDYYGTPLSELEAANDAGQFLLAQCEVRGLEQLLKHDIDLKSVFINISRDEQLRRYTLRSDVAETLAQRLEESQRERDHFKKLQRRFPDRFLTIDGIQPVEDIYHTIERFLFR